MRRLKCLVVDDEIEGIEAVVAQIKKRHDLVLVAKTMDAMEVIDLVKIYQIELVFVDLHMPNLHGLDLIRLLTDQVEVICCSADNVYGQALFELGVTFYLNKPMKELTFNMAIDRVWTSLERKRNGKGGEQMTPFNLDNYMSFQTSKGMIMQLQLIDIECIEAMLEHCIVTHTDGVDELCIGIGKFEKLLPANHFLRVHRSFIVGRKNIGSIDYTQNNILLRNSNRKESIPIGKEYKANVKEIFSLRN